ncbi:arginine decarboxylase, pyruvoyl-dependent [Desulfofarcimen acetoxidans DSM 771]|jgi:arginine decarboxylase|uniref:Pyruvoyl-dependent arginine decarboxylase AaxB n=1 Tax=Desulfofarcimen acetoxidans (strain ATCC 49208 / DSM 771 / KCTC 5769 / VKM B-1644 / 5575) TaxID=485916 RepID=C8VVZ3_DESAS|nr:arginine decarboxylase, pyruvoyl-dependent [Desulfofarcimen acetoxidans]ACV64280.1 arginine decarboxylase, pyruvoyl-dependent [Desulfofarcimen acetoxidans DSM 771]
MLPTPKKYFITAGCSEGKSRLTAFDNALLRARIGNINLIRVSSILPPGAEFDPELKIPFGSLVPTAYGYIISDVPGEKIAAAVGIGLSSDTFGVIMEFSGRCSRDEAYKAIEDMLKEAFETRGMDLVDMKIEAVDHVVKEVGCCLAAVPLWY